MIAAAAERSRDLEIPGERFVATAIVRVGHRQIANAMVGADQAETLAVEPGLELGCNIG